MRIAFVSTFFTGATLPLMKHLADRQHQCDLYLMCRQEQTDIETLSFDKPVKGSDFSTIGKHNPIYNYLDESATITLIPYYIVRNRKYLVGLIPYFRNLFIIRQLASKIKQGKYDLAYINVNEEHDAIICEILAKFMRSKMVIAYHEVLESHTAEPKLKRVVTRTLNLGCPLITYSEHTKMQLKALSGKSDIWVVPFGPFETYRLFDTSVPIVSEPYVLFIGSIQPYKGLSFLYSTVVDRMKSFPLKIVVAGRGNDPTIEKVSNNEKFILINRFLLDAEFANLIKYARCVVCPYVSGSQSGVPMVAMVYGTPIVATRTAAFEEMIDDGKNGRLVDYGNGEQLSHAINDVAINRNFIPNYVPKRLRWNNIVEELLRTYEEISQDGKKGNDR